MRAIWFLYWKANLDFCSLALETADSDNASQLLYNAPPKCVLAKSLVYRCTKLTQWRAQGQSQRRMCRLAQKEYIACVEGIRLIYPDQNL